MKRIEIVGENYAGQWTKERIACRAVVLRDGQILLTCETKRGAWMIPGGGIEPGETNEACCVREAAEETGVRVAPSFGFLEIDEYYGDRKWVNLYYLCTVTGEERRALTEREAAAGLEPRWIPWEDAMTIFGNHQSYAGTDEDRRGMYFREYTALCEAQKYL